MCFSFTLSVNQFRSRVFTTSKVQKRALLTLCCKSSLYQEDRETWQRVRARNVALIVVTWVVQERNNIRHFCLLTLVVTCVLFFETRFSTVLFFMAENGCENARRN